MHGELTYLTEVRFLFAGYKIKILLQSLDSVYCVCVDYNTGNESMHYNFPLSVMIFAKAHGAHSNMNFLPVQSHP